MGTQGMVTLMRGKQVVAKITVGCSGDQAKKMAQLIAKQEVQAVAMNCSALSPEHLLKLAEDLNFGCSSCILVVTKNPDGDFSLCSPEYSIRVKSKSSVSSVEIIPNYKLRVDTFDIPNFNARWECGFCPYVYAVDLDSGKVRKLKSYEKKS
jgi:hypothetical protein